jgi:hypothetical protein
MMNSAVLIPLLYWLTDASVTQIVVSSVLLAVIAFFVGDQWILRRSNNTVATIADIGLSGMFLWGVADWYNWSFSLTELVITVAVLAIVEAMFHHMLKKWDKQNHNFSIEPERK